MIYKTFIKLILDKMCAIFLLIIVSPIIFSVCVILLFLYRGNPFFLQERPGRNTKLFKLLKFKTMRSAFDKHGAPLPDRIRITPVGKFLRATSIDELPQLFNVLKGDMSMIGPRPLLLSYLPLYNEFQSQRHLVRPGITGWAQVNGRNSISWEEKFKLDVWYVNNICFLVDLKIIFLTILIIFRRIGVNQSKTNTMEPFLGNE